MIDDLEIPKHRRRGGEKKPYVVEIKMRGRWRRWNKYRTLKQRDQALKVLQNKTDHGMKLFEYRAG